MSNLDPGYVLRRNHEALSQSPTRSPGRPFFFGGASPTKIDYSKKNRVPKFNLSTGGPSQSSGPLRLREVLPVSAFAGPGRRRKEKGQEARGSARVADRGSHGKPSLAVLVGFGGGAKDGKLLSFRVPKRVGEIARYLRSWRNLCFEVMKRPTFGSMLKCVERMLNRRYQQFR